MKGKRFLALVLCIALVCGSIIPLSRAFAANTTSESQTETGDVYSLVHNYYRIKSVGNGKYLQANSAGYDAKTTTVSNAMVFYFQASDLSEYILYDSDSKYLTYNTFNAIVRNNTLNDRTRYRVSKNPDGTYSFYSIAKKQYVSVKNKATGLVWSNTIDSNSKFILEKCSGNNPFPEADVCMDILDANGNPVNVMDIMAKIPVGENIVGYADTHAHLNHNLGSGQATFYGETFDPLGITKALDDCSGNHGSGGVLDIWGAAVDGATGHATAGYPSFTYWPTAYTTDHIQTYYKWIERSYLAGQRVLVHQCVNNEILGKITNALPPYKNGPTDDMTVVDLELDNVYKLQDYVDAQYGGPGKGWFRIVTDAEEARQVISEGKMAVFLSIEVDTLFGVTQDYIGLNKAGKLSDAAMNAGLAKIEEALEKYYNRGIRSIFTIHALNNGFGGCQLYQGEIFSIMNKLKTSDYYQPEISTNPRVFYKQPKANLPADAQGHMNEQGLTETGKWFIRKLIDKKIVIEVDHLSDKSFNDVLDIVWEEKYPGIIASHTRILDMFDPEDEAWEQLDIPRLIKVYQLGGIISPMLWETLDQHQICASDYLETMIELSNNAQAPTTTFLASKKDDKSAIGDAALYGRYDGPYEIPTTWYNMNSDPSDDLILGLPFGSDVNGACTLPNFKKVEGVYDEVDYESGIGALYEGLYSDKVASVKINAQKTGDRTFNINDESNGSFAHYGLLPDFLKRLSSRSDRVNIDATFNSAEAYIRMLERMENYSDTYPVRDDSQWIVTSTEYWHD